MIRQVSRQELAETFEQVKNWGRWGDSDQRGTLNLIADKKRVQAGKLIQNGIVVSAALPLATEAGPGNPKPVMHLMVRAGDIVGATGSADYFAISFHGMTNTHIDALCHIFYEGRMYNGLPPQLVTSVGAHALSIESATAGIVSRGVLLDIPRTRRADWIEADDPVTIADLGQAESSQGLHVQAGDILLIRTGRHKKRAERGELLWDPAVGLAGMELSCAKWLHDRDVAVLGCDGITDILPSPLIGAGLPMHTLAITGMGLHLIDNCDLERLAQVCSELGRWEFCLSLAPLTLMGGTGSPVNPIAVF